MRTKYLLLTFLMLTCMYGSAQVVNDTPPTSPLPYVFTKVDEMPSSVYSLNDYIATNIRYPDSAKENNIEGRVLVKFVVNEDGSISDCRVIRSVSKVLDDEALRVLAMMPPWKPGKINGKPVKVYFTLPIVFKLQ